MFTEPETNNRFNIISQVLSTSVFTFLSKIKKHCAHFAITVLITHIKIKQAVLGELFNQISKTFTYYF